MPSIYDISGLFPGPNGLGTTEANSHPATFISGNSSLPLGEGESGIYIPIADFKYSPLSLDTNSPNQDVRYLIWNILEKLSDFTNFEEPDFRSIACEETNLFLFTTDAGDLRRKDYNVSLWFKPLTQVELEQSLEWDIDKVTEQY